MTGHPPWQSAIVALLDGDVRAARWVEQGGSSLNETWRLELGRERYFVKTHDASRLPMLEAEAEGLRELARAEAVRVPVPVRCAAEGAFAFLVLEWLELVPGGRDAALGAALARLHRTTAKAFGWPRGNTIGTTPQDNRWAASWAVFYRDRRIAPQLALAGRRGAASTLRRDGERLLAVIPQLLAGHEPMASLLHGDLWSGNASRLATGEPVIFDPAVYFGDRETDLAMTELFGDFSPEFHAAYRAAWPVDAGYRLRRTLYNLYHVLNHFNLFGGGYGGQAQAMVAQLLAEAR